jgi:hypothetical protein
LNANAVIRPTWITTFIATWNGVCPEISCHDTPARQSRGRCTDRQSASTASEKNSSSAVLKPAGQAEIKAVAAEVEAFRPWKIPHLSLHRNGSSSDL